MDWAEVVLGDAWQEFQRSPMTRAAMLAGNAYEMHAHWVIGRHVCSGGRDDVSAAVRGDVRALEKLRHMAWCRPAAERIRARVAYLRGDRESAQALLRSCREGYAAIGWRMYEVQTRFALGRLVGGSEGAELVERALQSLRDAGVAAPEATLRTIYPEFVS